MSDEMDPGKVPEQGGEHGQRRKVERLELEAEVLVRRASGHSYRVRVFDISPQGCKVEFVERPMIDERIWIKVEGLDALEGIVRWTEGFVVGVDFPHPMHAAVFDHVVQRLR